MRGREPPPTRRTYRAPRTGSRCARRRTPVTDEVGDAPDGATLPIIPSCHAASCSHVRKTDGPTVGEGGIVYTACRLYIPLVYTDAVQSLNERERSSHGDSEGRASVGQRPATARTE